MSPIADYNNHYSSTFGGQPVLLFGLESAADPEHVAIGMAKVHLPDVPGHIGGGKCDLQPGGDAMLVHLLTRTALVRALVCGEISGCGCWQAPEG